MNFYSFLVTVSPYDEIIQRCQLDLFNGDSIQ